MFQLKILLQKRAAGEAQGEENKPVSEENKPVSEENTPVERRKLTKGRL